MLTTSPLDVLQEKKLRSTKQNLQDQEKTVWSSTSSKKNTKKRLHNGYPWHGSLHPAERSPTSSPHTVPSQFQECFFAFPTFPNRWFVFLLWFLIHQLFWVNRYSNQDLDTSSHSKQPRRRRRDLLNPERHLRSHQSISLLLCGHRNGWASNRPGKKSVSASTVANLGASNHVPKLTWNGPPAATRELPRQSCFSFFVQARSCSTAHLCCSVPSQRILLASEGKRKMLQWVGMMLQLLQTFHLIKGLPSYEKLRSVCAYVCVCDAKKSRLTVACVGTLGAARLRRGWGADPRRDWGIAFRGFFGVRSSIGGSKAGLLFAI